MNHHLPDPIKNLALLFRDLPGVGPKTALRFAYALLREPREKSENLARSLLALHSHMKVCGSCMSFAMESPCAICRDTERNQKILCVVAESRDVSTIELTGAFPGYYFVLGGLLSPLDGITPDMLHLAELNRHLSMHPEIREILLAFNSDLKGESTILYLTKELAHHKLNITTLARGLPMGADLEYADEVTLADAVSGRRTIS